jgi:ABC-2 type transport system permease protein
MTALWLVYRRELAAYFRTPVGFIVAAVMLTLDGLLFNAFALGGGERLSSEVLHDFFNHSSGTTMGAAMFLAMRLLAEEHQTGSYVLLYTAPVRDWQIVLGKYFSAFTFLAILTIFTLYMPALIFVNGRVSAGHIVAGYTGLLLLGASALAMGLFGSALARTQIVAVLLGTLVLLTLLLCWMLARVTEPPVNDLITNLALWDLHYRPFMEGVVSTRHIVYYLSVTAFFLLATTRVLEARRWR